MKKIISLLFIVFLFQSCGSSLVGKGYNFESAEALSSYLKEKNWTFELEQISPRNIGSNISLSDYGFWVKGYEMKCYLPFFGRAHRAGYNQGNPMSFEGKIEEYVVEKPKDSKTVDLQMKVNSNMTIYKFYVRCSVNRKVDVYVISNDIESLRYIGSMKYVKPKEEN